MKNKKIISFFFILFCLVSLSNALGEEIIFETPEIEVLENGNLLKAHKGGKAVIDSNTEIIADKFEYNKLTKVLTAIGNAQGTSETILPFSFWDRLTKFNIAIFI